MASGRRGVGAGKRARAHRRRSEGVVSGVVASGWWWPVCAEPVTRKGVH